MKKWIEFGVYIPSLQGKGLGFQGTVNGRHREIYGGGKLIEGKLCFFTISYPSAIFLT